MTDLWFRNTQSCLSVCAEEGVNRLTWTRQHLSRLHSDGILFVRQFYMSTPIRPKILIIGVQGSAEYSIFDRFDQPQAVYPSWSGKGDDLDDLYRMIENPVGENERMCTDPRVPTSLRPVLGQKHRIVLHNSPNNQSSSGKQFWLHMSQIQIDYPQVELFVNGSQSFSTLFGLRFKAGDLGLCDLGDTNKNFVLPNGMTVKLDKGEVHKLLQWEDWIKVMGFTINQIVTNQMERYRFRIRAARWAATHWADNYRFHSTGKNAAPDYEASDSTYKPPQSRAIVMRRKFTTVDADKMLCNRCRIAPGCKLYRQDSICGLKDSRVGDLAKFFQSRNADLIVQGLANITQLQARRLENSIEAEASAGEVDPEVTKQMNSLFANGVKLAKLVDPDLNGGPKVQVNVGVNGGNAQVVTSVNPKELMADIVHSLEMQGIKRERITAEMLEGVLKSMALDGDKVRAIEATSVSHEAASSKKLVKALEGEIVKVPLMPPLTSTARDE